MLGGTRVTQERVPPRALGSTGRGFFAVASPAPVFRNILSDLSVARDVSVLGIAGATAPPMAIGRDAECQHR